MKKRIGDRRGRGRFEIVGTLTGTLETLRRFKVRNVGAGGALIDSTVPFAPRSRMNGRLTLRGNIREIRAEVRHTSTIPDREEGARYLVGVQWDSSTRVDDLLGIEPVRSSAGPRQGSERRASARQNAGADAEIGQANWATVELIDISTIGVLFASPTAVPVGEKGELRVRLGERSFTAAIEVKRSDPPVPSHSEYRLGAAFVSLDEGNSVHLDDFIGHSR